MNDEPKTNDEYVYINTYKHLSVAYISSACVHAKSLQLCTTLCDPWTVAHQAPLPVGFFRQEYWSGLPCPHPGDAPEAGLKPVSPTLAGRFFTSSATREVSQ